jgi:hypothetical protein
MPEFEIKNWMTGGVIFSIETDNWKLAIEAAVKANANLRSANLSYADLRSANLSSANLSYADLRYAVNLVLPTGETWKQYLTETVPALLTAGGKSLESFAEHFQCHEWTNCPMAHAFDVHDLQDVPVLLRPRAEQFVQLFDTGQIPWPLPTAEQLDAIEAEAIAGREKAKA